MKGSRDDPSRRTLRPGEQILPPGYRLDYSDPNVLILRSPQEEEAIVARFSVRGYVAETVERVAWEHYLDGPRPT